MTQLALDSVGSALRFGRQQWRLVITVASAEQAIVCPAEALLDDGQARAMATARGLARAAEYRWSRTAASTLDAYAKACAHRLARRGAA